MKQKNKQCTLPGQVTTICLKLSTYLVQFSLSRPYILSNSDGSSNDFEDLRRYKSTSFIDNNSLPFSERKKRMLLIMNNKPFARVGSNPIRDFALLNE
jgi:hypothetical protein